MTALEYFESIVTQQALVCGIEHRIESARVAAGPHGQQMGAIGGGGSHDSLACIDSLIDSDAETQLSREKAKLRRLLDRATDILYGRDANGGVAKAIGTDEADMLCFHYLQGESWASIAKRYEPVTSNLTMWCKYRAEWTCRQIDRIGMETLIDW